GDRFRQSGADRDEGALHRHRRRNDHDIHDRGHHHDVDDGFDHIVHDGSHHDDHYLHGTDHDVHRTNHYLYCTDDDLHRTNHLHHRHHHDDHRADDGNNDDDVYDVYHDDHRTDGGDDLAQHGDAHRGGGTRRQCRRARGQVQIGRQWLHHRHPVLQEHHQYRHSRRQPVEQHGNKAGVGDLLRRERVRLATGDLQDSGRHHGQHGLRRVVPHQIRALRRR